MQASGRKMRTASRDFDFPVRCPFTLLLRLESLFSTRNRLDESRNPGSVDSRQEHRQWDRAQQTHQKDHGLEHGNTLRV
jgi:hypothetical protein